MVTYTFENGTVADADKVNVNFSESDQRWLNEFVGANYSGIIAHSSTVYSIIHTGGDIYQRSGTTMTQKNTDLDTYSYIRLCKADSTHGVAVEDSASPEVAFTDDSGATWTTKTSIGFSGGVNDVSFPTASLIVVGGADAGNDNVKYSTDDGATWNDATTSPSAEVYCLDMYDGSTGYAVDSGGNIWKTSDGGDTWTDTADDTISTMSQANSILCLDASTCIIVSTDGVVHHYNNSTNTVSRYSYYLLHDYNGGIIYTDGIIYTLIHSSQTNNAPILLISQDNGVNWYSELVPTNTVGGLDVSKCLFASYDTGKVMYYNGSGLLKRDFTNLT